MADESIPSVLGGQEIPADLVHRHVRLQPRSAQQRLALDNRYFRQDHQIFTLDWSLDPWIFVDNADPAQPYCLVLLRIDLRFSPGTVVNPPSVKAPMHGYFQAMLSIDITPDRPVGEIAWLQSSPATVNQQVTKTESTTDSLSFNVGYASAGASRTWSYQSGTSFTISDWNIAETGSGNRMGWKFWQALPWDGEAGVSYADVRRLPHLSEYTAQVHAQGIWKTDRIPENTIGFDVEMVHLPQLTWGAEKGGARPPDEKYVKKVTDRFELDFSGLRTG